MLTRSRMGVTRGKTMVPMSTRGRTMLPKAGGSTDLESRPGARKEPHAAKLCFQPGKTMRQVTVAIMRPVPEKRLRIFELAGELIDSRGEVDVDTAALRQPQINLALAEVEGYVRATRQATEALQKLPAR